MLLTCANDHRLDELFTVETGLNNARAAEQRVSRMLLGAV